ncbi:Zn-dependent oxidoreductase [Marinobacterium rhizophilum]|uniref:Zn-dependent oxidoreductase n=1 Tax=Marinobacterium rhizophilum TaxID=420402 RepID=UPI000362E96B|nr:Zn-dependent oxidoreductase [Marinobacterium rhizophilum]
MKAFQVNAVQNYALADVQTPAVKEKEVLIRTAFAGICGSDMHIIHGQNPFVQFPRITGHEYSGTVAAVGDAVEGIQVGDRVCVDPVVSCGHCYPCRIGRPNVCSKLQVIGVHRDGGFGEYSCVPAGNVIRLPETVTLEQAALVEPYSIASNVLNRMAPLPGDTLLVYGAGVIGLTIVQVARALGIERIIVSDIIDERLEAAKALGASETINSAEQDLEARISELTAAEGVPLIADAACIPALLPQMLRIASPAGRIGLLGFTATPSDLVQLEVIKKELTLVGSRLNNGRFAEVLDMIADGRLDPCALISHRVELNGMCEAISLIEDHPSLTRKVLVEMKG